MPADVDHVEELARLAALHQARLAEALATLEDRIADLLASAPLRDGDLFDLEWAVQSRAEIRRLVEEEYLKTVDGIIREYTAVAGGTAEMLATYGAFTKLDPSIINQLQRLSFQGFQDIGTHDRDIAAN